jgi:NADPH:quinone reductase-like Zn-dependent oxidoreductase
MKSNAIRIHEYGGPDVLQWEEVDIPDPAAGEAQIRHTAIGLNFIDVYHRMGLYPTELPTGLGSEAAGVIEAISTGVTDFASTRSGISDTGMEAKTACQYRLGRASPNKPDIMTNNGFVNRE